MKETGIIMSGDHPQKVLDGTKTMTRRIYGLGKINKNPDDWNVFHCVDHGRPPFWRFVGKEKSNDRPIIDINCPYGQVGDRLWVRETHYRWGKWIKNGFSKTGKQKWTFNSPDREVCYTDEPPTHIFPNKARNTVGWFKRPSIFMPRWASRITLEITEVRVERVQKITEEDAKAEGTSLFIPSNPYKEYHNHQTSFCYLWDSLNAKRGYGWEVNPWVWVVSFRRFDGQT